MRSRSLRAGPAGGNERRFEALWNRPRKLTDWLGARRRPAWPEVQVHEIEAACVRECRVRSEEGLLGTQSEYAPLQLFVLAMMDEYAERYPGVRQHCDAIADRVFAMDLTGEAEAP